MLAAVILLFMTLLAAGLVVDQMPCFLGVPNCDESQLPERECSKSFSIALMSRQFSDCRGLFEQRGTTGRRVKLRAEASVSIIH
jgi:hypothetical protein